MRRSRSWLKVITSALMLVLAVGLWIVFAPSQLGGNVSYIILSGNSMEPDLHRYDLVLARKTGSYQIGDVVAYRHPDIGPVVHRIVATNTQGFVLQGDNNDWQDGYNPREADVIGEYWFHIPIVGKLITQFRSPVVLAAIATMLGIAFLLSMRSASTEESQGRRESAVNEHDDRVQSWITVVAAIGIAAVVLGIFAFTRPVHRDVSTPFSYSHYGDFAYTADAATGVYDGNQVDTGQPIFRELADDIDVQYTYGFVSEQPPRDFEATARLSATISNLNGWSREIEIQPDTVFHDPSFAMTGSIDLNQMQEYIDNLESKTGVVARNYILSFTAAATISGSLAGQQLSNQISHDVQFLMDQAQIQLLPDRAEDSTPWLSVDTDQVVVTSQEMNTISILGWQLKVALARQIAFGALFLVGIALIALLALARNQAPAASAKKRPGWRLRHFSR